LDPVNAYAMEGLQELQRTGGLKQF
jgi:hypothetical protein